MMHLRPFLEVLLAGKTPPPPLSLPLPLPVPIIATPTPTSTSTPLSIPIPLTSSVAVGASASTSVPSLFLTTSPIQNPSTLSYLNPTVNENTSQVQKMNGIMKGVYITINVRNVSLDLLRVPAADAVGTMLANAFSLQITALRASIDIMDLVKADVKLRSFDIIDTRNISVDYVFKKIFCPVVNMDASVASWSSSASSTIDSLNKDKKKGTVKDKETDKDKDKKGKEIDKNESKINNKTNNKINNSTDKTTLESKSNTVTTEKKYADKERDVLPDLLHVTYAQLSSLTSMIDVSVLNIASFVSTDTILDLSYVAMENFFSIMDLIASPSPSLSIALSASPINPLPATQIPSPVTVPAQVFLPSDPLPPVLLSSPTPLPTTSVPSLTVPSLTLPLHFSLIPSTTPDINTNMKMNINTSSYPTGVTYSNSAVSHHQSSSTLSSSSSDNPISPTSESLLFALSDDTSPLVCTSPPPITRPSNQHTPHTPHTAGPNSNNTPQHATTAPHNQVLLQPDGTSTMMNVVVRVTNPRLILLEDPTTDESRAIVGSCDIEVHYSRENRYSAGISTITRLQNRELRESLHVSVHNHEVFVLRSMLAWNPQPIVEPMGMELNLRRRTVNSVLLSSSLSVDVDNLYARVSINDILLAQSIMTRRSLTEPSKASSSASASTTSTSSARSSLSNTLVRRVSGKKEQGALEGVEANAVRITGTGGGTGVVGEEETPCPSYTYSLNMGSLSLVGINDFNGQNMPVIRALLDGTTFFAEGEHQKMIGKGSLIASTYFYNPRLSLWESIMDRWHPSLSLTSWALGWGVEIKSEHTMQLTVSGIMLQSLLQTFSLFFRSSDIVEREEISDVLIHNTLGLGIELDIYDSASGVLIMDLKGIDSKPVPRLQIPGKKRNFTGPVRNIPSVVDLHFRGGVERQPLHHIPFNINKPRPYNLHPCVGLVGTSVETCSASDKRRSVPHTPPILLEPIEEEVFENCRYDLIIGRYELCCVVSCRVVSCCVVLCCAVDDVYF